ncbi:hypothetical protein DFH05DRAFT_1292790 [Lentinula detonsa]|uniref:Uncharacterized protein n=1 Tax=Lentinula detonsa TaxID=2804962 RepID=A0A9W8NY43_9AGAR|nr:hypothetical protein DFH05DRAFT_1292790 [Lentinula detonsa]
MVGQANDPPEDKLKNLVRLVANGTAEVFKRDWKKRQGSLGSGLTQCQFLVAKTSYVQTRKIRNGKRSLVTDSVKAEEDGGSEGGEKKCKYESYEVFRGILGYVVQWFVGKELKMGVDAMAEELKRRSERNQV